MKSRILTILLVLSIIWTCTATINSINAAGSYNIVITADKDTVNYGDEVTVSFNLKDITMDPGIGAVMGKIEYDKTVFEKITSTSIKSGDGWASVTYNDVDGNAGEGSFVVERENASSITIKTDNLLFNVTFKVKAKDSCSAKPGDPTNIKVSNISASNGESDQSISTVTGTIKIGEGSSTNKAPVITGVTDGGKYTKPVTPVITDDDLDKVELYKDGTLVSGFTSGTKISDLGSYKLTATDKAGNKTEVNFTIEKDSHPDSKAFKVLMDANNNKVEAGGTLVLKVSVSDITANGGIGTFAGKLEYDESVFEKLEATSFKSGEEWETITFNPNNGKLLTNVSSGLNITAKSTVFTVTFKVLKTAQLGETSIVLSGINASNGKEDLYVSDVEGKITIVPEGSLKPTATPAKPTATPTKATPTPAKVTPTPSSPYATPTPGGVVPVGDTTKPVISGVVDGATYTNEVTATVTDENLSRVVIYKDGAVALDKTMTSTSFTVKFSTNGTYRIVATDAAGNQSEVTFVVRIGGVQPTPTAIVITPTPQKVQPVPTGTVDITDQPTVIPYAGPGDLILPAIYVIAAMGAIAFIQYKRIKNL